MKGADVLLAALREKGVDTIFGYPGGAIMPVYDALLGSGIRHVLVRHEQAAAPPTSSPESRTHISIPCR